MRVGNPQGIRPKEERAMKVNCKIEDGTLNVNMLGELDESCATRVRIELDSVISENKLSRAVFDMSGVSFMDSTGIGMLIGRYKLLKAKGVPVYISSPKSVVDKLLTLSGIYEIMPRIN